MSKKLTAILRKDLSYNHEDKEVFHTEGKRVLRALAKKLNLVKGTFDVRSNKGGIAVSGEVTLHAGNFYLQISQNSLGQDREILLRSCKGQKDYTGGQNNFLPVTRLENLDDMIFSIKKVAPVQTSPGIQTAHSQSIIDKLEHLVGELPPVLKFAVENQIEQEFSKTDKPSGMG